MISPFGTWVSPITPDLVATAMVDLLDVQIDGDDVYWIEGRPQEAGRHVLVRHRADGSTADVLPPPHSARTRVHEYGGAATAVAGGTICFSSFPDQRLYRLDGNAGPTPLTPAHPDAALRYADGRIDRSRHLWIGVREDHRDPGREAVNTIVALNLGSEGPGTLLVQGQDFYASPRLSPDGRLLTWLAWSHPDMPWV